MEKMPRAIIISSRVQAPLVFAESLIDIVLDAILGDIGGYAARARNIGCVPIKRDCTCPHVGSVALGTDRRRAVRDGNKAGIGGSLLAGGRLGIIDLSKN